MEDSSEDTIFEERKELMVSPLGGKPTLRIAHFLRPSGMLSSSPWSHTVIPTTASKRKESASKILFKCSSRPPKEWETWIQSLHSKYQSVWKKAGIYEAIMGSKYHIVKHRKLVFGLAEKWCLETNTFIFPWGEATITLEDMMVLGGFSVLGHSVSCPLHTREMVDTENKLIEARKTARSANERFVTNSSWLKHFMGSGSELEHVAFLCFWLSKFLFKSSNNNVLEKRVYPMAIHLATGSRIALAPSVLSSIYQELGLLKLRLMDNGNHPLYLFAPFHLVKLWAWERFPDLGFSPNLISPGEPRLARWHRFKHAKIENIRSSLDSAAECFRWRPYATAVENWVFPKFYQDREQWVLVDSCLDKELESFARCLRMCKLVGLDCIQQYLPHRVAMQFGLDQDVPACIPPQHNHSPQIEWIRYNRLIGDAKIYVPPRLMESDVTTQYLQWWKQLILAQKDPIKYYVRKPRNTKRVCRSYVENKLDYVSIPPGFASKCGGAENSILGSLDKPNYEENGPQFDLKPSSHHQCQNTSHLELDDGGVAVKVELLGSPTTPNIAQEKVSIGKPEGVTSNEFETEERHFNKNIIGNNEERGKFARFGKSELEFEARIRRLERTVARIKAQRLNRRI